MKTILVFGTFDGVHEGHLAFLNEAKRLGDKLVVCLALDDTVDVLKEKGTLNSYKTRVWDLREIEIIDEIVPGDDEIGSYGVIHQVHPDIIALGYDQIALHDDLKRWFKEQGSSTPVKVMKSYKPETYKSSILNS
jgi:FAD synthetase